MVTEKMDEILVREVQEGNILAFEEIVRRYQKRLIWFVTRIVHDQARAEEICQDAFFKTYQVIDRVDPSKKFSTFLFEIAKNKAIDEIRKTKREVPLQDIAVEEKLVDETGIREAVEKLPKAYREPVKLYYFSDLSYQEISRKLGMPINTVRTHLRRAKERLKQWLI